MTARREQAVAVPAPATSAGRLAELVARRAPVHILRVGRYSKFVGFMRYALPLIAVLILCLVVVWPLMSGREDGFRITYASLQQVDGSLRMINARYLCSDGRGQPFQLTAAEATQKDADSDLVSLKTLSGDLFLEDGTWTTISADSGRYLRAAETLDLAGAVAVFSDRGHELHTETAHLDLRAGTAYGDQPVNGQGPLGLIEGKRFRIGDEGAHLLLEGGVKATIFPGAKEKP